MQDRGINSTFKKIIYESSEMVFLADDTYPYSIFYANEAFEILIGESLTERNLVGLGLDITAYIFKEELILSHGQKDYSFHLELPQDNGSNYYLFYKGKEIKSHGFPSKKEALKFFSSQLDLIAVGKHDHLTFVNPSLTPVLGYSPEEVLYTNLCPLIHEGDLLNVQRVWKEMRETSGTVFQTIRFKAKSKEYKHLECSIRFEPESFFVIARDITQKIAEKEEIQKQEKLLLGASKHAISGKWIYEISSQSFSEESSLNQLLETYSPEGLSSKLISEKLLAELCSKVGNSEINGRLELTKERFLEYSGFVASSDPNKIYGIAWDNSEITKLQKKVFFQESLWMESPEALMVVDADGNILASNGEAMRLFGILKKEDLNHLTDLSIYFEEGNSWQDWVKIPQHDTLVTRFSTLLLNEKGKQMTLEVAARKFSQKDGRMVSLSFRNISEKIRLEKTLEESSDFLVNLMEQVPGGLYQLVLNSEGQMNFSFLSKGINSVLGLSQEEILEFTDISVAISKVHPQDLPQVIMSSVASAKKMEPWQCQFRVKSGDPDNPYRWVLGAARPQALENGDTVWYGYLTDISKQKEFESKLDDARKSAERANQIKSDFLSMISHELRTPLNAISGSVYSLFQENPTSNQKAALTTINFAVDNLIIMINDLLDFQKIEAGKLTIEQNPFNLKELLEQIMKGLSFHAKDSKNDLDLVLSDGLEIQVKGDKTRLSQVMNNLITNALKFTNQGKVEVKVELVGQVRNKVRVYFEVKDSGIGIAPENLGKIFNDFDQVKPTFSTKYGGTGLGLSITRKLLTLMGGQIQVESEVGVGSRFYFELEFEKVSEQSMTSTPSKITSRSFDELHLLMAEDNDVNALVLGKIIKKWGFTFDRANNGLEAVEAAKANQYDCILMDIQMPEMDGFDATLAIKKFSEVPVIALTAAAKLEIMERIEECGFEGFVAKPIDAGELLKRIKEVISEKDHKA